MHFIFEYHIALLLLLLLPCFYYCKKRTKRRFLAKLEWVSRGRLFIDWQTVLRAAIFALGVLALANPILYRATVPSQKSGLSIVLALDTSGSMRESGFSKEQEDLTKFALLQQIAKAFIQKRSGDNVGIVAFGTFAFTASPVSYDLEGVAALLEMLEVEIAGKNTAIGEGIEQGIKTLLFEKAKERVIILVTDGKNNSGTISPKEAVLHAKKEKIKIYAIGLGKESDYDKVLLDRIAYESGGKAFGATDAKILEEIYQEIGKLLPSPICSPHYLDKEVLYLYPLLLAILLLSLYLYQRRVR